MVAKGLSVAALGSTGEVIGCTIVTVPAMRRDVGTLPALAPVAALTSALWDRYAAFHPTPPGVAVLVDMAAVASDHGGVGVYQAMRHEVHARARSQGFTKVVGELSSSATQHVVIEKLGHTKRVEIAFTEFEHMGSYPFRGIKDPRAIILAEGLL
jgi:hypothetical protein